MLEKNCTNCKYIIPVEGADYGFCNFKTRLGDKANVHTVCSDYEVQEEPTYTNEEAQEVLLGIKCCTDPKSKGCSACPFARYECSCQQDLMFAAEAVIEKLQRELDGYIVDQGIWLTANEGLEKENAKLKAENKELWDSYHKGYTVGYEYGKQDARTADRDIASYTEVSRPDDANWEIKY